MPQGRPIWGHFDERLFAVVQVLDRERDQTGTEQASSTSRTIAWKQRDDRVEVPVGRFPVKNRAVMPDN